MSGKAPFLINLILSLSAEVVPIAQHDPQSNKNMSDIIIYYVDNYHTLWDVLISIDCCHV